MNKIIIEILYIFLIYVSSLKVSFRPITVSALDSGCVLVCACVRMLYMRAHVCACLIVCVCVRARARARVHACLCVRVCDLFFQNIYIGQWRGGFVCAFCFAESILFKEKTQLDFIKNNFQFYW